MPRANFYLLQSDSTEARLQFTCRLTEKACTLAHRVFILALNAEQAQTLNELLWSYPPASFIPHRLAQATDLGEPVVLGDNINLANHHDVLINLADAVGVSATKFQRINEILGSDEHSLQQGRERFKLYRDNGFELEKFEI